MSPVKASEAQLYYANLLNKLTLFGFAVLLITFLVYVSGILPSFVPMDQVIQYWNQPSHNYLQANKIQPGWTWVGKINYGDFLVNLPISILAGVTIVCYLGVITKFLKSKEYILVGIAIAEVLVLSAAASGILQTGSH
jgi:hypothetical protein